MTRETQNPTDTDTVGTRDFTSVETVHCEDPKHNNPTKLTALVREIDDLHQSIQNGG